MHNYSIRDHVIFDTKLGHDDRVAEIIDMGLCQTLVDGYVAAVRALEVVLHQLSTDLDLDELATAPEKYDALERVVRKALSVADPGNPQLRYFDE